MKLCMLRLSSKWLSCPESRQELYNDLAAMSLVVEVPYQYIKRRDLSINIDRLTCNSSPSPGLMMSFRGTINDKVTEMVQERSQYKQILTIFLGSNFILLFSSYLLHDNLDGCQDSYSPNCSFLCVFLKF